MARTTTGFVLPRRPPRHPTRDWGRVAPPRPPAALLAFARAQARQLVLARRLSRAVAERRSPSFGHSFPVG